MTQQVYTVQRCNFTPDMMDKIAEKFNNQTFAQASVFFKLFYYNPRFKTSTFTSQRERELKKPR